MLNKDTTLEVRSSILGQDDDYQPINPRGSKLKRAALFSLFVLGICGFAINLSSPAVHEEEEVLSLQQQTL